MNNCIYASTSNMFLINTQRVSLQNGFFVSKNSDCLRSSLSPHGLYYLNILFMKVVTLSNIRYTLIPEPFIDCGYSQIS